MDLKDVEALIKSEMLKHGLTMKGWTYDFGKAKKQFGKCFPARKLIRISATLASMNNEDRVIKTIWHEIAHALVGCRHGHDNVWKAKCIEIGGNGARCFSRVNTEMLPEHSVKSININGKFYSQGDPMVVKTRRGVKEAEFVEYKPQNYAYPVIAKINGKRYKLSKEHVV